MEEFVLFIMSFILIFIIYQLFIISPAKKRKKSGNKKSNKSVKDKELFEIMYLQARYKLDMKKVSYNQLLQICAITSSFDIALIVSLMGFIDNFILKILFCLVFTIVIILLSYHLVYLFYKKKGMIKNE